MQFPACWGLPCSDREGFQPKEKPTTQSLAMKESGKMDIVIIETIKNFIKQIPLGKTLGTSHYEEGRTPERARTEVSSR
jgi:hypothetical protein